MTAPGDDGGKKKFPPGTVVIWIAGAGIGLWLLISGLVGILSGGC